MLNAIPLKHPFLHNGTHYLAVTVRDVPQFEREQTAMEYRRRPLSAIVALVARSTNMPFEAACELSLEDMQSISERIGFRLNLN